MYKGPGGIKPDAASPGFKNVLLKPNFVKGLDHFEASHQGPFGMISSSWKRTATGIIYTITIPPNSTGTVDLPVQKNQRLFKDGKQLFNLNKTYSTVLPAGSYQFEWK